MMTKQWPDWLPPNWRQGGKWLTFLGVACFVIPLRIHGVSHAESACPAVVVTPSFTIVYGYATVGDRPIPVGAIVEAISPRGDTVGCFEATASGAYGLMFVYGQAQASTRLCRACGLAKP